jgi:hypothetical protein
MKKQPHVLAAASECNTFTVTEGDEAFASVGLNNERDIQEALACLQLPHMPSALHECDRNGLKSPQKQKHQQHRDIHQQLPSLTIMVCADIDLKSTSALAEYTLQQMNRVFDANKIDFIIAVGPCTQDSDLQHYCQGGKHRTNMKTRRRMMQHQQSRQRQQQQQQQHTPQYTDGNAMGPFFRSREESAALEGLVTGSLSQLENIVCRVVYCPGWTDPLTVLQPRCGVKRLTPNSRNVHQQWLPLAPGLGCAGLFYLDGTDKLVADYHDSCYHDGHKDDDSDASEEQDSMAILSEQLKKLQQWYVRHSLDGTILRCPFVIVS